MWRLVVLAVGLVAGILCIWQAMLRARMAAWSRERVDEALQTDEDRDPRVFRRSRIMRRDRWAAGVMGLLIGGMLYWIWNWPLSYAVALGLMSGLLVWQLETWLHQSRLRKAEQQLADSIDMLVAAVKAGASLQGALESTLDNTRRPWKEELTEVVGRIRYGEDPVQVLSDLSERIPLETVRLFTQTLAVNWSVGGRLSQTLANVGRTIRDRLELSRRMHAMTTQARLSVISVIAVTYFIAILMWRNDPDRMRLFLSSIVGQGLVSVSIVLQSTGIVWIARLSTPRF